MGPEDKVTILLPRCAEVTIAMLGSAQGGGGIYSARPGDSCRPCELHHGRRQCPTAHHIRRILDRISGQLASFPIFSIDRQSAELDAYPDTKPPSGRAKRRQPVLHDLHIGHHRQTQRRAADAQNAVTPCRGPKIYPIDETDGGPARLLGVIRRLGGRDLLPLSAGATLVVGTFDIMRSGDRFSQILQGLGIISSLAPPRCCRW